MSFVRAQADYGIVVIITALILVSAILVVFFQLAGGSTCYFNINNLETLERKFCKTWWDAGYDSDSVPSFREVEIPSRCFDKDDADFVEAHCNIQTFEEDGKCFTRPPSLEECKERYEITYAPEEYVEPLD